MDIAYAVTPVITWTLVGPIKFLINSARARKWAFNLVGNGGFPSNHSAVVSSMATLIALREGISNPAFGVAITLAFIVVIDANSLRQHVGRQAASINKLARKIPAPLDSQEREPAEAAELRERMGHTVVEICGGLVTGMLIATGINWLFGAAG